MEKENQLVPERIVQLTLEIIYLLTGERYGPVKRETSDHVTPGSVSGGWRRSQSPGMESPPPFLTAERNKDKKAELLLGEAVSAVVVEVSRVSEGRSAQAVERHPSSDLCDLPAPSDHTGEGELFIAINGQVYPKMEADVGGCSEEECDQLVSVQDGRLVCNTRNNHGGTTLHPRNGPLSGVSGNNAAGSTEGMAGVSEILLSGGEAPTSLCAPQAQYKDTVKQEELMETPEDEIRFPGTNEEDLHQNFKAQEQSSCSDCGKQFSCRSLLSGHEKIHTGLKQCTCLECGKGFNRIDNLAAHTRNGPLSRVSGNNAASSTENMAGVSEILLSGGEAPTSLCAPQAQYKDTVKQEELMETPEDEIRFPGTNEEEEDLHQNFKAQEQSSCSDCGKQFSCRSLLSGHEKIHTGLKQFTCLECGKGFNRVDNLAAHTRIHGREKPFMCHCGRAFLRKKSLVLHRRSHSGEKPYSCAECGKSFTNLSDLDRHKRFHSNQNPLLCSQCGRCFMSKGDLSRHQRVHRDKIYPCPECSRSFAMQPDLVRHLQQHLTPRVKFPCSECGKQFPSKSQLARHWITHSGEKPFECSECGKRFNRVSNLDAHIKTHVGEKPFPCAECGKRFLWRCQLNIHQRTHTGEKPYICSDCGWQFASNSNLVKHRRLHTGERPYPCGDCGRRFTNKPDLTKHQRTHAKETPYVCAQCEECFPDSSALLRHQMTHSQGGGSS